MHNQNVAIFIMVKLSVVDFYNFLERHSTQVVN